MPLVLLSQLFGTFPFDRRGKISIIRLIYSIFIFLLAVYTSPLYVSNRSMVKSPAKHWVRHILEITNTGIHLFVWLSQFKAILTCDLPGIVFVKGTNIFEPLITVLGITGAASIEVVLLFNRINRKNIFFIRLAERMMSVGATRSVKCLILMQFRNAVDNISSKIGAISKADISAAIQLQKVAINHAKKLNDFYQAQLLFCTAAIFITLSSESYNIINMFGKGFSIYLDKNNVKLFLLFEEILWFIYAVYWLLRVVNSCESFYEKMEDLNGKIYNTVKSDENEKSKERNQLQVIKQPSFSFTACRFFPIGYSLITSVFGAASTYLVILLDLSS
ncbi:7tm Chemosensory receptor [Nesidiocoris tenuis]|uniref:Gustatory receptor n=1 Tax=Nesidiocoris tenuis TaxID=355587 RepID=A0ABN7BFI5_9HEMI|nr:7tm Chemosensory receptor [Nesidiocoris tenuis]